MDSEKVIHIDWKPKWSGGAPMPQLFSNGQKTYLTYIVADWDKESVLEILDLDQTDSSDELIALVEFNGGTFKFGIE